jgi:hypothetical protein
MTEQGAKPFVEPTLFELVQKYAKDITEGRVKAGDRLKRTTPIIVFCQNFFLQFFENVFDHPITGIDMQSKAEATRLRIGTNGKDNDSKRRLIAQFESLCDLWPDALGFGYGGSKGGFVDFHKRYLPRLLDRIVSWAATVKNEPLVEAAKGARNAYNDALRHLR